MALRFRPRKPVGLWGRTSVITSGRCSLTRTLPRGWEKATGKRPDADLLEALYREFAPLQTEVVKHYCDVIPGVPAVVKQLRSRGIKIANTTGFDAGMMTDLKRLAAAGEYATDLWVTPDLVGKGRPAPWMIYYAAKELDVYPLSTFVKVGDTPIDVAEAPMPACGASRSCDRAMKSACRRRSWPICRRRSGTQSWPPRRAKLTTCGPHYVIDTVADLMPVIDDVSARIARGERP